MFMRDIRSCLKIIKIRNQRKALLTKLSKILNVNVQNIIDKTYKNYIIVYKVSKIMLIMLSIK